MTKFTREWLQQTIADFESTRDDAPFGLDEDDAKILAALKLALATMQQEPVAEVLSSRPGNDTSTIDRALPVGTQLYAAMLQGAELVTAAYKLPDGWVAVPVEPTEDMIVNGFESEPDESFSDEKEWETYDAMSGCQQAAHRAKLCWAAMVAAVPKT